MTLPPSLTRLTDVTRRIPIRLIRESIVTLRTEYEEASLIELGESFAEQGQLQAIVVQPTEDEHYELVIGSRRLRAAKRKGFEDIAAYVIDRRSPVELLFIALAENLHRKDLNPFEEAQGFLRLMKEYGLALKDIARGVNKHETYVRNRLKLLSMPDDVVGMIAEQEIPIASVNSLARLPTGDDQVRIAQLAAHHHLSQPELSTLVQRELDEPKRAPRDTYELTAFKVCAKIGEYVNFLQKLPRRMPLRNLNASERLAMHKALQSLEDEIRSLKEHTRSDLVPKPRTSGSEAPSNHGQEWTTKDIRRINAPRRPSDEELAVELGRSVSAILGMRALTKEKKP